MATQVAARPLTRREMASYLFGAAFLALLAMLAGIVLWAMWPHPQLVNLGAVTEFSTDGPTRQVVTLTSGETVPVWVIHAQDRWLVFLGRVNIAPAWNCDYRWVPTNNRFEDPCSGFKWALTGELLTYFEHTPRQWEAGLRDLDQYPVAVTDGQLRVNFNKLVRGVKRTEPPPNVTCKVFMYTPSVPFYNCGLNRLP